MNPPKRRARLGRDGGDDFATFAAHRTPAAFGHGSARMYERISLAIRAETIHILLQIVFRLHMVAQVLLPEEEVS